VFAPPLESSCVRAVCHHMKMEPHIIDIVTSELLFEQYSVPSLAYCVDSVMSFYRNQLSPKSPFMSDGLVVSFNTASTSVLPVLGGKGIMSHAKRCAARSHLVPDGSSRANHMLGQDTMGRFSVL
jgi:hypothetical protein